jgi:acyl dehydratase
MPPVLLVRAVNTAADSDNRIHDDQVAAEYGFSGGLVPGVTVYGYMASAVIGYFASAWLQSGAMDVRFSEPFYEGEQVAVSIAEEEGGRLRVEAGARASATAWIDLAGPWKDVPPVHPMPDRVLASREAMRPGTILGTIEKTLDLSEPGMSAPLDAFLGEERFAHPAVILALANEILIQNYILGPWIHSSSEVHNLSPVRDGDCLQARGKIVDAYERKGHELLVLDVAILKGEVPATRIRHTAIWQPRKK